MMVIYGQRFGNRIHQSISAFHTAFSLVAGLFMMSPFWWLTLNDFESSHNSLTKKKTLKKGNKPLCCCVAIPTHFPKRLWRVLPGWKRVFTFTSRGRWDIFVHNAAWVTSEEDEWVRRETAKIRGGSWYVFLSSVECFFLIVWGLESLSFPRVHPSLRVYLHLLLFSSGAHPFPLYHFFLILLANLFRRGKKFKPQ